MRIFNLKFISNGNLDLRLRISRSRNNITLDNNSGGGEEGRREGVVQNVIPVCSARLSNIQM